MTREERSTLEQPRRLQSEHPDNWDTRASEIDRLNRTDPHEGLKRAADWLQMERERGSAEGETRALRAHSHALRFLGRYDEAIAQYDDTERRFRALGLEAEAARTQIGHVNALRYKGLYEEAVQLASSGREYFLEHGEDLQAAKQSNNLGTLFRPMGRLKDALEAYSVARAVFRRLREDSAVADVEQNIGNVLVDLGRFEDAVPRLRAAERIRRRLGLRSEVALTLVNIGVLSHRRADYGRAIQALTDARRIYEELQGERGAALANLQMLPACLALNLRAESHDAAARAVEGLRRLDMPLELGQALLASSRVSEQDGEVATAVAQIDEAYGLFAQLGNRIWSADARIQAARLRALATAESASELLEVLQSAEEATESLREAGALDRALFGQLVQSALLARLGDTETALERLAGAARGAAAIGADHLLYQAHATMGSLQAETDINQAIDSYKRAIHHLEQVRSRALADDLKLAFLADKTDLYEQIVDLLLQTDAHDSVAAAFRYVERSKSRTLLEELVGGANAEAGTRSRVRKLARKVRDIRTSLNSTYARAYGADVTPSADSVARSNQAELVARLEREYEQATRELQLSVRAASPGGAPLSELELIETPLPPSMALVEYYSVHGEMLAFVKRGTRLTLRRLGATESIDRQAERIQFQIGKGTLGSEYLLANLENLRRGIDRCLQGLWRLALEPLADDLEGVEHLVVIPHGSLHGVPFHALHDGERYLAERMTISYSPSAGVYFASCRFGATDAGRTLVVGVEDAGLPWVSHEVETVTRVSAGGRVLDGTQATSAALWKAAGTFDTLHLATHAVFRADNPAFSSIKLADAWLTVSDLAEIARGANLVTLSACETAVGGLTIGDEVIGLTRGLLGAGCASVVASLWPVNDESTARLMEHFYRSLQTGLTAAAALREAMLTLREQYDHPYFWAPFVVAGGGSTRAQCQELAA
ncbi:MAG: CHAT domain-containing tetratricopeptide repeat protein [Chloroflexota bacterium]